MNYLTLYSEIVEVLNKNDKGITYYTMPEMAANINLWDSMYKNKAPWVDGKKTKGANIPAAVASEHAKLITLEMDIGISGSKLADFLNEPLQKGVVSKLRKYIEYGLAKGSLIIKPVPTANGIRTQFLQAGSFFLIDFDGADNITKCVFTDQIRRGRFIYTLLEVHTLEDDVYTVENRLFKSTNDQRLGSEVELSEVGKWASLGATASFVGIDSLPFGMFCCPMANQVDTSSPLGVSVFSRADELIQEADKRYSSICWEYDGTQLAVHIAESMLKYNKEQGKFEVPEGRERLYRTVAYELGAKDKPLIEAFSPEIRSTPLFEGFNNQLRLIEFNCSLAYGTLSDPNNVDKTAEEIKTSKQRSYTFVKDAQTALEKAITDWAKAAAFWAQIYGFAPNGDYDLSFEWGDSILSNPDADRQNDREDLANGTFRPEEYRAKWRDETLEEAKANLPLTASVVIE